MRRNFYITEEQYKLALKEGILPNDAQKINVEANTDGYTNAEDALKGTEEKIKKAGVTDPKKDFNINVPTNKLKNTNINNLGKNTEIVSTTQGNNSNTAAVSENKLITKKELQENRLKTIKKNSEVYTVKDFLNKIKIK